MMLKVIIETAFAPRRTTLARVVCILSGFLVAQAWLCETSYAKEVENSDGVLRIGVSLFKPWVMSTSKTGQDMDEDQDAEDPCPAGYVGREALTGFEIEVAMRIADDLDKTPCFKIVKWQQLIHGLKADHYDVIISGMAITAKRAKSVYFSHPYGSSGIRLVANKERTKAVSNLSELQRNHPVGVVNETFSHQFAKCNGFTNLWCFDTTEEAQYALLVDFSTEDTSVPARRSNGSQGDERACVQCRTCEPESPCFIDAYLESDPLPSVIALIDHEKVDVPMTKPLASYRTAFAVKKGNQDLLNFLNSWIVAREDDHWLDKKAKYWFESLAWRESAASTELP